jgi:hypothetical protein
MKIANKIVMTLAGLVLIFASVLKIHELLVVCIPGWQEHGVWESWEFTLLQIPVELCLGIWLVSGLFRKAAWLAGMLAYCGFIFVTLYKGIIGAESCGCFGKIHVNPWITLGLIDTPMFLLLVLNRPGRDYKLLPPPWPNIWHAIIFAAPIFGVLIFTAPLLVAFKPVCIKPDEPVKHVIQDPRVKPTDPNVSQGTNKQADFWSWLQYIDIADHLKEGLVIVLMYHYDCPTCAVMVPKYDQYFRKMKESGGDSMKIAFVAAPPYSDKGPVPADTICLRGKLIEKGDLKFAITSPYVVALLNGQVIKTWKQGTAPEPERIMEEIDAVFAEP